MKKLPSPTLPQDGGIGPAFFDGESIGGARRLSASQQVCTKSYKLGGSKNEVNHHYQLNISYLIKVGTTIEKGVNVKLIFIKTKINYETK